MKPKNEKQKQEQRKEAEKVGLWCFYQGNLGFFMAKVDFDSIVVGLEPEITEAKPAIDYKNLIVIPDEARELLKKLIRWSKSESKAWQ